ncbi:response regulator [Sulfitobacter delicatus]|uniref:Response regulator receiver domain-containing protein n=1 Tax=Sulfitobacter delicatus TaxID=218672 RepID=A0A1G7XA11_9RHOB|nr:response regulator [Sulfitobacter delicatus]SDG81006.1 Response regulator receiver domain-containing protein [Sulfitobacter delicatus]
MTVDDEKVDQMLYRRILERSGLVDKVLAFRRAADALAYLKQPDCEGVDVILLDVNMPQMNGFEFLETAVAELGDNFVNGVVIMLTTSLNPEDKARALRFNVVRDCLDKPLRSENLSAIAEMLAGSSAGDERG